MLSKACQYAIKALIFISSEVIEGNDPVTLKSIAEAIDSPPAFTSKILQNLVSASILTSIKGSGGGFHITSTKIKSIRIISIIKAIEGDHISSSCFLGLTECSDVNPCPIHHMYAPIREQMNSQLFRTSLYEIIQDPKLKKYHLKS